MTTAENFLNSLTKNLPDTIQSPDSPNIYALIAERNGGKLAVSCLFEYGKPAKYKDGYVNSCGLTVRFAVTPDAEGKPSFTGFGLRSKPLPFKGKDGIVEAGRAAKSFFPVTYWPCSFPEFAEAAERQQVYDQLVAFIKALVEKEGGTMLFDDAILADVLRAKFTGAEIEPLDLFVAPTIVAEAPEAKPEPDDADDENEDGEDNA